MIQMVSLASSIVSLEKASDPLFTWFDNNLMKSNVNKYHFLVSSNEKVTIKYAVMKLLKRRKVLGAHFDSGLSFDYHILEFCKKTSRKVCAPTRATLNKSISKRGVLMNAFF